MGVTIHVPVVPGIKNSEGVPYSGCQGAWEGKALSSYSGRQQFVTSENIISRSTALVQISEKKKRLEFS